MDLDVSHYSNEDMMTLLHLDPSTLTKSDIDSAVNAELKKHEHHPTVLEFYKSIKNHLLSTFSDKPSPTYQVDVAKGIINPDLKNTIVRFINIDSSARMELFPNNLTSDSYTFELTEPLQNVLSMSLYSLELPQSWYTNSVWKGTTAFIMYITTSKGQTVYNVSIPDGNYSTMGIVSTVEDSINALIKPSISVAMSLSPINGKCVMTFTSTDDILVQITWFDSAFEYENMQETRSNSSLGWMLGFRESISTSISINNTSTFVLYASSIVDTSGTKYIIIALNDYKTNRINRSLIGVNTHPHITIRKPHVFDESLSIFKTATSRIRAIHASPRTMPDYKLQSINAISAQVNVKNRFAQYESSDAFAKVPVKKLDWNKTDNGNIVMLDGNPGRLIVESGGPLQLQTREYFGPVEITNLMVELYDDKGKLLGLNGMDWSMTLAVKSLYQY